MLETDWMREIEGLSFSGCFIFMEAGNKARVNLFFNVNVIDGWGGKNEKSI